MNLGNLCQTESLLWLVRASFPTAGELASLSRTRRRHLAESLAVRQRAAVARIKKALALLSPAQILRLTQVNFKKLLPE